MELEKKKKPKKSKDHEGFSQKFPQFAFRIPSGPKAEKTMERVKKNLKRLHEHFKAKIDTKENKIINKNDILLEALDIGLIELIDKENI